MRSYAVKSRAAFGGYRPADVAALYGVPKTGPLPPQTVAIIELGGGCIAADMQLAAAVDGYPMPSIGNLSVDGATNSPGSDADGEVLLDGQIIAGIWSYATGLPASLLYVWCQNTGASFARGISAAVAARVAAISISWGGPEDSWSPDEIAACEAALLAAERAGIPVFVASGDDGSTDGETGNHVDYPAGSSLAVSCGGTSKPPGGPETAWSGSGGGYSAEGRGVPDVAGVADPETGWRIYQSGTQVYGGTSCVAPLFAALAAIAAGLRAPGGKLPSLPAGLYDHPAAFNDIKTGGNGGYTASVGWDPVTGLGSPKGATLIPVLSGNPSVATTITMTLTGPLPAGAYTITLKGTADMKPRDISAATIAALNAASNALAVAQAADAAVASLQSQTAAAQSVAASDHADAASKVQAALAAVNAELGVTPAAA